MLRKPLTFLLIIILSINACKERKEQKEPAPAKVILNESIDEPIEKSASIPVVLMGTSDDLQALEYFNILDNSYLFGINHKEISKEVQGDTMVLQLNAVEQPQLMEVMAFGEEHFYNTKFYLVPGDTIHFEIKGGNIYSSGARDSKNSFYQYLNNETAEYATNRYKGNIQKYGSNVREIYKQKIVFLNAFLIENPSISSDAEAVIRQDLKFEYYYNLIEPRNVHSHDNKYVNEQDGLLPILQRETAKTEEIVDLDKYFGAIDIEDFADSTAINNAYFKNAINPFIRYYFLSSEDLPYTREKFLEEKDFIEKHLSGSVKNYAIARMISDYHHKGFGYSKENIALMQTVISTYESRFEKVSYLERMEGIKSQLGSFNFKLSEAALNTQLINKAGDSLYLKDALVGTAQLKILDLWASWCPPCVRDIRETVIFKEELAKEVNIEWIYLSMDDSADPWKKSSENLQHALNTDKSYLVTASFKSRLAKAFKMKSIPRYVILDQQNRIVIENALSPDDQENFRKMVLNIVAN